MGTKSPGKRTPYGRAVSRLHHEGGVCENRLCKTTRGLTIDHIIPAAFLKMLALEWYIDNDEENFQVLCKRCNGNKGSLLDHTHPKTDQLLLKYINFYLDDSRIVTEKMRPTFLLRHLKVQCDDVPWEFELIGAKREMTPQEYQEQLEKLHMV